MNWPYVQERKHKIYKKKKALFKLNKMIRTLKLIELGKKFRVCLAKVSLIEV